MIDWEWLTFAALDAAALYAIVAAREEVFVVEQRCAYRDADGRVLMVAISLHPPGRFAYSMVLARNRR